MTRTVQMDLLKALVTECLSAAAEEIIRIVQRTIEDHEEDEFCPQWTEDRRLRQMDVDVKTPSDEQTDDATSESKPHRIELDSDTENSDVAQDLDEPLNVLKPFSCPICRSGFSSKKAMARHVKKHPEGVASSYQCQLCDQRFCDRSEFIVHARIHEEIEPRQSEDGGQSFNQRNGSGLELAVEETEKEDDGEGGQSEIKILPLPVPSYNQTDFEQESLQPLCLFHIQRVSNGDKDAQTLLDVDQIKTEPPEPEPAFERQQNSGPFAAEDAGAEANVLMGKSTELILQVEVGTSQKPYKCPYCSKCFSLTKTLIRHMKIHSEDKFYRCRLCGRRFCQKSDLVNHTRVHTGEKPYRCQECHKAFAQKGNLVVHMRTHTAEKPYP
ncbi:zinc finger protein 271-like [Sphaeramia orbicularis]|uniref:zinc finger protein 271-like n=1 Tax=Sphaeramia orbicularis TaxID=375764 RepID=UPI00117D66C7|nr:zinc finger protein 271-like [Sphaeramia orbicularis]XP_030018960.1 zinc finger protein 271-like [Sphaeramia orbicularis]XP_030018961.1 zinc finger protein 271-like [Sphaeramia orbicularis]XP_030018962.1 zinc finger protein 271-like [Sphaeramia orbicularis]